MSLVCFFLAATRKGAALNIISRNRTVDDAPFRSQTPGVAASASAANASKDGRARSAFLLSTALAATRISRMTGAPPAPVQITLDRQCISTVKKKSIG
jgi:hypothetical protein